MPVTSRAGIFFHYNCAMDGKLKVVLCWHMHQPCYRDPLSDEYVLPWTYLHAIKDYVDMAAHLEACPAARVVVNFTPTLLEQLTDYERQIAAYLGGGTAIRDPLLAALGASGYGGQDEDRIDILRACLRAHEQNQIQRHPAYARLVGIARGAVAAPGVCAYLSDQFFADLLVWYHLAWLGESVRRSDARAQALVQQGQHYTRSQRLEFLAGIGELIRSIVPRYRRLMESGQVELSVTPYAHPIAPLLIDRTVTREAMPEVALPQAPQYPDGEARARWHVQESIRVFESYFGRRPAGCWPAEGGVSARTLEVLGEAGFAWVASGQGVLGNSARRFQALAPPQRPYRVHDAGPACFFRDDGLSDLIGFQYAKWHADDAVANLAGHLHNIRRTCNDASRSVVAIILDGENAWDYYPANGWYFLSALYRRLAQDPHLDMNTFSDCLASGMPVETLPGLVAGSWIYGTFSTWIGELDKNRAWDLLDAAKLAVDRHLASAPVGDGERRAIERQLAICEGSDWFWWFGPHHARDTVAEFDGLFRRHLLALYRMMGIAPPPDLDVPMAQGREQGPTQSSMLPAKGQA
jgi:alpha-amylase/alpha-mannosidase (GH57 family)